MCWREYILYGYALAANMPLPVLRCVYRRVWLEPFIVGKCPGDYVGVRLSRPRFAHRGVWMEPFILR